MLLKTLHCVCATGNIFLLSWKVLIWLIKSLTFFRYHLAISSLRSRGKSTRILPYLFRFTVKLNLVVMIVSLINFQRIYFLIDTLQIQSSTRVKQFEYFYNKISWSDIPVKTLKVQSCKSYNNKYMIALTEIRNTEIFVFIAILVFKLLSRKVLFINRKNKRNC